ncbi:unnamed protein product, partial [Ascophyllum nodosum]
MPPPSPLPPPPPPALHQVSLHPFSHFQRARAPSRPWAPFPARIRPCVFVSILRCAALREWKFERVAPRSGREAVQHPCTSLSSASPLSQRAHVRQCSSTKTPTHPPTCPTPPHSAHGRRIPNLFPYTPPLLPFPPLLPPLPSPNP